MWQPVIDNILLQLLEKEYRRLELIRSDIVKDNKAITGQACFLYNGIYHSEWGGNPLPKGVVFGKPLDPSLVGRMVAYEADRKTIDTDKERIKQMFTLLLRKCETIQDLRDALPDGLKDTVMGCGQLNRTQPEAWTLLDNPRHYNQYLRIRDKIYFYISAKLLY